MSVLQRAIEQAKEAYNCDVGCDSLNAAEKYLEACRLMKEALSDLPDAQKESVERKIDEYRARAATLIKSQEEATTRTKSDDDMFLKDAEKRLHQLQIDPNSVEGLDQRFQHVFGKPALQNVDYAKYIAEQEQLEQDEDYQIRKIIDQATVMAGFDEDGAKETHGTAAQKEHRRKRQHRHGDRSEESHGKGSRHRRRHSSSSQDGSESSESTSSSGESSSLSSSDATAEDEPCRHAASPQKSAHGHSQQKQGVSRSKQGRLDEYQTQIYKEDSELRATIGPMPSNPEKLKEWNAMQRMADEELEKKLRAYAKWKKTGK